jgi:dihydrofolate synthase/folylpolyglutamate synthase
LARDGVTRRSTPPDTHVPGTPGIDPLPGRILPPPAPGGDWDLARTRDVLRSLGDPHLASPTLHVGGTNGKGSVAAIWSAALSAAGHRVGLYTSPHLCSYRERFRLDGKPVTEVELAAAAAQIYDAVEAGGLTFFEASTVLAFQLFAARGVDVAVVEVGLGGRLDATNVVEPVLTAITNVALDHTEYLGESLAEIAAEKAGIIKAGVPVIVGEVRAEPLALLEAAADRAGAALIAVPPPSAPDLRLDGGGSRVNLETEAWGRLELKVPLPGPHQAHNAALAVRGLERLPVGLRPDRPAVTAGVAGVRWPGRLQVERRDGRTWIFDVAHNVAAAEAMAAGVTALSPPRPVVAVVGMMEDKDVEGVLRVLAPRVEGMILTDPPSVPPGRRWDPAAASELLRSGAAGSSGFVAVESDFRRALHRARGLAATGSLLVTGSHHTVGDALMAEGFPPCE